MVICFANCVKGGGGGAKRFLYKNVHPSIDFANNGLGFIGSWLCKKVHCNITSPSIHCFVQAIGKLISFGEAGKQVVLQKGTSLH